MENETQVSECTSKCTNEKNKNAIKREILIKVYVSITGYYQLQSTT